MPQQHEDVLAFGSYPFWQLAVQDFHAAAHLFVRDVETLEGFDEDVAQVSVEGFLYAQDFLFALFGEGAAEVLADESPPIPYYIIYDGVGDVAQHIQDAQGQSCQKPHDVVFLLCPVLVQCCFVLLARAKVRRKSEK
jgi:hypothetical protein